MGVLVCEYDEKENANVCNSEQTWQCPIDGTCCPKEGGHYRNTFHLSGYRIPQLLQYAVLSPWASVVETLAVPLVSPAETEELVIGYSTSNNRLSPFYLVTTALCHSQCESSLSADCVCVIGGERCAWCTRSVDIRIRRRLRVHSKHAAHHRFPRVLSVDYNGSRGSYTE